MFQYYSPSFTNTKNRKRQAYLRAGCPCRPPWCRTPAAGSTQSCGCSPSSPHQWPPPCSPPGCCPRTWCCPQCSGRRGQAPGSSVVATLFYLLRGESKRIWILFASYLHVLVYSQTPFIRIIRFIFASKYSHKFEYKYSICCKTNTFSQLANICFKLFRLEANVRKTLSEFHIQANIRLQIFANKRIFACKYSHTTEFSFCIASNYKGQPFTILGLN